MIRPAPFLPAVLMLAAACAPADGVTRSAAELQAIATTQQPDGSCWAREVTPAIYEQVPGQVQVVQAEIADDGTVLRPPIYRNATVPKVVKPRGELTFEAPCPDQMTPEFIGSVQRALKVRALYRGDITRRMDPPTIAAIRRYQAKRGLQSGHLSLETARALGLIAVELPAG
ncbi:peptidoglycan-binding domain-containing protein [Thalassococcus sp. BH17M4-6]|uniref:peptidoglycan-binding domain-containing protein n=1 Tax=Thalassococcus sp. BH17M4-6 TaxID=3413148 RepID=UPI003BE9BCAE